MKTNRPSPKQPARLPVETVRGQLKRLVRLAVLRDVHIRARLNGCRDSVRRLAGCMQGGRFIPAQLWREGARGRKRLVNRIRRWSVAAGGPTLSSARDRLPAGSRVAAGRLARWRQPSIHAQPRRTEPKNLRQAPDSGGDGRSSGEPSRPGIASCAAEAGRRAPALDPAHGGTRRAPHGGWRLPARAAQPARCGTDGRRGRRCGGTGPSGDRGSADDRRPRGIGIRPVHPPGSLPRARIRPSPALIEARFGARSPVRRRAPSPLRD